MTKSDTSKSLQETGLRDPEAEKRIFEFVMDELYEKHTPLSQVLIALVHSLAAVGNGYVDKAGWEDFIKWVVLVLENNGPKETKALKKQVSKDNK